MNEYMGDTVLINPSASPWAAYPCAPHIERLITGLNTNSLLRKVPSGWIVGRSGREFSAWRDSKGLPNTGAVKAFKERVPCLKISHLDKATTKNNKSRYGAIVYEFMCNFDMMRHFTSLTPRGRYAMRKLAGDNAEIMHTLAVAQLYCTATRHLPKESENED